MTLAFRLYGNFRWPPSPLDVAQGSRAGVIDVFYLPVGDVRRAAIRWSPGEVIPGLFLPDKTIPRTVKPEDAVAFLEDGKVAKVFWIDAEAASDWLAFRGAFLIEQYPDAGPRLRLPLVNNIDYAAPESGKVFSGLRVLKGKQLELRINLPLPVEQSKASSTRSFPMAARYNTSSKVVPLSIQAFYGGWQAETTSSGTRIELKKHDAINVFRLGAFGMSERGNKPDNFLSYRDQTASIGQYWPENASRFAEDLLGQYGFEVGKESWLRYGESGPADLSLRFESSDELITSLTYRIRVIRNGNQNPGDGSDLALEGDIFKLRLSDELGGEATTDDKVYYVVKKVDGWLRIGNDISADCQVSWQISDDVIWSNDPGRDWYPSVALRMHWAETIKDITGTSVDATTLFGGGLLKQANFAFRAAQVAMATGEAGQPHSFLPTLSYKDPNKPFRFALYSSPLRAVVDDDGILSWGRPRNTDGSFSGPWKRPPMRLSLASATELIKDTDEAKDMLALTVTAGGMSFFNEAAASFNLEFSHDAGWPPASSDDIEDSEPFFASFAALVTATPAKEWRGRLASLEFRGTGALNNPTNQDELRGHLRIGGKGARDGLAAGGPAIFYQRGRVATEFRIVIPVSAIEPITVDVSRFDRSGRATPLLIPVNERGGTSTSQGRYWLRATETLPMRQDRRLRADIIENSDEAGPRSFVVLSSEPFSVFRFTQQPFSSRGSADNASVAVYSGDDRIWQYRKVSPYYHYTLPPQSIGESADKPRRLEIHDLPASQDKEAAPSEPVQKDPSKFTENPPRPFRATFKDDGMLDEALSNMQRRAVEQRLTPAAEIWIAPSDVERGYFMPEASSYDIFRQTGAFGLGAALAFLRAEFLYGLPVGIDVSKEGGIARGARVAEIEALVGRLAGGALETDADRDLAGRWDALRAAVARRPERLEIWARDLGSTVDFAPARFSDGVRFALRGTALHRPPLLDQTNDQSANAEDPWTWPKVGVTTPEQKSAEDTNAPAKPRHHPQGLSGGALWPVESLNLFNVMLEQPDSSGGTIEQIALSPTGGDAVQKAEFLGGQVAIISETRNGRVQRQQVEVIGRICALWHRAKHVVVYERTVNPSAQFAPKFDDDPDRTRSRRPILRKVREYIELLQPERGYPDFDTATQRSAGFLERVRFNASIINVDSAWSSEVADFGWQIPLWNRQAARERPQVYPMPDVAFVSTAEGDGEKPTVAQDCRDTDMLFFFADFKAGTSDTDRWKPYLGLDYINLPHAKAMADVVDAKSIENPGVGGGYESEGRRRAVSRFLPGVRRFTWRLAPAAQKTALNAGRAGKPVYVGLDSVSFMRAGHRDDTHKAFPQGSPLEAALKIDATGASKPELTGLKYWSADGGGATIDGADTMSAHIGKLVKTLTDTPSDTATIDNVMGELATLWTGGLKDKLAGMTGGNLTNLKTVTSGIASGALCQKLKDDAVGLIKRKEMLVTSALRDWLTEIDGALASGQAVLDTTKVDIIDDLATRAQAYVRPLFEEASQDIAQIGEGVEKARAIVVDVEVEIDLVIARARQRVDQFNAGYDKDKPWSPDRRKAFREGIEACIASVVNDIEAAIDEAAQRLATELNNASQSLAGHVAKLLKQAAAAEAGALGELTKVGAAVDRLLDRTDAALQELQSKASDIQGKIPELIAKMKSDAELGKNPELQKAVLGLLTAAKTAVKAGHVQIDKALDLAQKLDDLVDGSVGGTEALIRDLTTELTNLGNATVTSIDGYAELATQLSAAGFEALKGELEDVAAAIIEDVDGVIDEVDARLAGIGNEVDAVVLPATYWLDTTLAKANAALKEIPARILPIADDIAGSLDTVKEKLGPDNLFEKIVAELIRTAVAAVLEPIPDTIDPRVREEVLLVRKRLQFLVEELVHRLRAVSGNAVDALGDVTAACDAVNQGVAEVEAYFKALGADAKAYLEGQFGPAFDALKSTYDTYGGDAKKLLDAVKTFDRTVRSLHNDLGRLQETAEAYAGRVLDAAGQLDDGGLLAVPNNVLKLYSAVTSAPELAALKADIDRIRSAFDELGDIIETTKANALFDRLSDELKAIGLSLPFDKIGDNLIPTNLTDLNIGAVFRNFGGTKLDKLFKGYRIPEGVRDAVKVTHDFDKKQARAWVQVDINAPFPGRRSLFSLGVFKADFIDMQLTGRVRLEASKDQQKVSVTGFGRIGTTIDAVVAGQSMVRFEKFGLSFTKEKGLDVEFDPKNVRLNPQFKFIQDFLSSMYPELPGGLEWIRDNGMPVGVEHNFAIPNLSLNFGTSGVSNISLENHFRLIALPDFLLANRFNLSTVERPFIFSIFIIGGTGYIQIEAEYKPVRDELTVLVEAAAGGSAQLAFAFGPFTGQVFITLSGVLSYRKTIGKAGGGLSISVVLVIAGHVDVAGIVTVGITLMLRMTYRDNGQIDADGSLTVTIRISRFFKLTARAQVKYKLRGGKSETSVSTSTSAEVDPEVARKAAKLEETAKKVQGAMK